MYNNNYCLTCYNYNYYKQVWPSGTLASLHALRPAYGRPQHAQCVEMCVHYGTVLTCHACMALCKAPISFPPRPPATTKPQWLLGSVLPRV